MQPTFCDTLGLERLTEAVCFKYQVLLAGLIMTNRIVPHGNAIGAVRHHIRAHLSKNDRMQMPNTTDFQRLMAS
jgi:hypothetical protein